MRTALRWCALATTSAMMAAAACGGGDGGPGMLDAGVPLDSTSGDSQSEADAALDSTGGDSSVDTSADSISDVTTDTTLDSPTDGPLDASGDVVDAAVDAPAEASNDAAGDAAIDAPIDAPSDAPLDAPLDAPVAACAAAVTTIQTFPGSMAGCGGGVAFASRASLCSASCHSCSAAEWVSFHGIVAPTNDYWTGDALVYTSGGTTGNCAASTTTGTACPTGPMHVCSGTTPDSFGNTCNIAQCGLNTVTPNEYFGGCASTAGTLCCCP